MSSNQVFQSWYQGNGKNKSDIADEAYNSVRKHLEQSSALSSEEKIMLKQSSTLEDVTNTVTDAFSKYEAKAEASKTRTWFQKVSESICHYGKVLDVFVQHHPEYVSLAWGLMKLLFIGVVNHSETLKLLSNSLCKVAQRLPRIELWSALYDTESMRLAVESLYSCIMEFLLKAHAWCNESKIRHIYHSITRPHELRYGDLLERITTCTSNISELATVGSQAELRIMHNAQSARLNDIIQTLQKAEITRKAQIDGLSCAISRLETSGKDHDKKLDWIMQWLEANRLTINDLLTKIETFHSIQTSAQLDTNQKLSTLQLSQALSTFSQDFDDPSYSYKQHLFLRKRRASGRASTTSTNEFWLSPKLREWSSSPHSSLAVVRGSFATRWALQDFAVDVIQALNTSSGSALWALGGAHRSRSNAALDTADLMRYLTCQALQLDGIVTTEKQISLRYSQLQNANGLREWLDLFKLVISDRTELVYLVIDLATVHPCAAGPDHLNCVHELIQMIKNIPAHAKVKVILLVYEMEWIKAIPKEVYDRLIPVKSSGSKGLQGKRMRQAVNARILPRRRANQ
ncbi:hypothetical protein F66182_6659 [Fusarium sp. NRRL 66182]|nr:hypothetical protein F66182_6659 [Fusarium sp. NRRL 66182]